MGTVKGLIFFAYAVISAFGLYKLKVADKILGIDFAVGAAAYGLGFIVWLFVLRAFPLSVAFPIAAGSLVIATQAFGFYLLKEPMHAVHLIGIGFIVVGIGIVFVKT